MISRPELGLDSPIWSDRETGCDNDSGALDVFSLF